MGKIEEIKQLMDGMTAPNRAAFEDELHSLAIRYSGPANMFRTDEETLDIIRLRQNNSTPPISYEDFKIKMKRKLYSE